MVLNVTITQVKGIFALKDLVTGCINVCPIRSELIILNIYFKKVLYWFSEPLQIGLYLSNKTKIFKIE